MADKRMFSKSVIDSDLFLDMPQSTQCLYFHLCMRADDDGFIDSVKRIKRIVGASDDDLKLLYIKKFIIAFEDGVIVIRHWRLHNTIKSDRYKVTQHTEKLSSLTQLKNKEYQENKELECKWNQNGNILEPDWIQSGAEIRLEENRIVKNSIYCEKSQNENIFTEQDTKFLVSKKNRKIFGDKLKKFESVYEAFSDKRGKKEAIDPFLDIKNLEEVYEDILEGAKKYSKHRDTIIKNGGTPKMLQGWLAGERWNDEIVSTYTEKPRAVIN